MLFISRPFTRYHFGYRGSRVPNNGATCHAARTARNSPETPAHRRCFKLTNRAASCPNNVQLLCGITDTVIANAFGTACCLFCAICGTVERTSSYKTLQRYSLYAALKNTQIYAYQRHLAMSSLSSRKLITPVKVFNRPSYVACTHASYDVTSERGDDARLFRTHSCGRWRTVNSRKKVDEKNDDWTIRPQWTLSVECCQNTVRLVPNWQPRENRPYVSDTFQLAQCFVISGRVIT